ncbi:MAG TPA: RNA polymerase subunit sigma [Bacteroidales bacterium]|jgi:RNA polymerase primary sigma factor|nr:RNA polymerase subunit sigma [Bacteroidales bacterium]
MRQLKITKQITQRADESISRYFHEISKYSIISAEEEVDLTVRIRNGDEVALEKLVVANLRFVISVAKQYQNQGLSFSDLINEGNVGLVKAAKKFDETRGFKFISYAVWWIRQSIIQAISDQTRIVRLPLNRISSINKITRAIPFLENEFERDPTNDEIANYLELTSDEVKQANDIRMRQISFDMPLSNESDSDFSLYDIVQTGNIPAPDNDSMVESLVTNIRRALNKLTKRESMILTMSFGLFNTPVYSLHDIALEYDMSTERIRQIKSRGLSKLKMLLKENCALLEY